MPGTESYCRQNHQTYYCTRDTGCTVVEPAPVSKPEPKPEPKPTPAIFYGRVVINTAKVHGNAKYHIFNAEGKSLCNDYDTTEDILLANARIDSPDIRMVCKHCRAKLNKN